VAALLVIAACGGGTAGDEVATSDDSIASSSQPSAPTPTTPPPPEATEPCGPPVRPVFDEISTSSIPEGPPFEATEVPTVDAGAQIGAPDFDDDGLIDRAGDGQPAVVLPQGRVEFAHGNEQLTVFDAGPLDDEPLDELWVIASTPRPTTISRSWVVPSTIAAGVHDPAEVGIEMPPGLPIPEPSGGDRLWITRPDDVDLTSGTTLLFAVADLLAPGTGGDATGVVPLATADGAATGVIDFDDDSPSLVTSVATEGDNLALRVRSGDGTVVALDSGEVEVLGSAFGLGTIEGLTGPADDRYVMLASSSRAGTQSIWWRIDDACPS